MSEREFGRTTLRQFAKNLNRLEESRARADLATGVVAVLLANIHRDKKQRARPFQITDLLPWLQRTLGDGRQSLKEMKSMVAHLSKVFGGKVYSLRDEEKRGAEGDR